MRYIEPKFSVGSPGTQEYADAWDRIFKGEVKALILLDPEGACAEAPTRESTCAPTLSACVCGTNHAESFEGVHVGGCPAMGRGEGRGYPNAPAPSNQNEGGVSGFPGVKE